MIYEYAISPDFIFELADNRMLCSIMHRTLQNSHHSVLSTYPKQLAKQIYNKIKQHINSSSGDTKAHWQNKGQILELLLKTIENKPKAKRFDVLNSFVEEHNRYPFQGVFSVQFDFERCVGLLWLEDEQCHFGKHPISVTAKRNSNDQSLAVAPVLQNAFEITFVDPYFFGEPRYINVYEEYFEYISASRHIRSDSNSNKITIIAAYFPNKRNPVPYSEFQMTCQQFAKIKPTNLTLEIRRIQELTGQQEIHDRYILTDIGGVSLGHGTDISDDSTTSSEVNIYLLEQNIWKKWRKAYKPNSTDFNWSEPPITIN